MRLDEILGPDDYAAINEAWARRWARFTRWVKARLPAAKRHAASLDHQFPFEDCAPEGAWRAASEPPSRQARRAELVGLE